MLWWKIAAGAVAGLVVGHFVAPGYTLWVVLGVVAGYLADLWTKGGNSSPEGSAKS